MTLTRSASEGGRSLDAQLGTKRCGAPALARALALRVSVVAAPPRQECGGIVSDPRTVPKTGGRHAGLL